MGADPRVAALACWRARRSARCRRRSAKEVRVRQLVRSGVLLCVLSLVASCTGAPAPAGGSGAAPDTSPIRVAGIYSLTGAQGINGVVFKEGSDAALKFVNSKGGIKGRKLEIEYFDDQSRPERTVALFQ